MSAVVFDIPLCISADQDVIQSGRIGDGVVFTENEFQRGKLSERCQVNDVIVGDVQQS